jgi:mevalonate kinase
MYCKGVIQPLRLPEIPILLTNTKIPKNTKVQISKVRELYDAFPQVISPVLDAMQAISETFQREFTLEEEEKPIINELGRLEVFYLQEVYEELNDSLLFE